MVLKKTGQWGTLTLGVLPEVKAWLIGLWIPCSPGAFTDEAETLGISAGWDWLSQRLKMFRSIEDVPWGGRAGGGGGVSRARGLWTFFLG